jgi:hypothetical protein
MSRNIRALYSASENLKSDPAHFCVKCHADEDQYSIDYLKNYKEASMWTVAVVLLILWALGLVSSYTLGGFIHLLLVVAVIVLLLRVIQGRRVMP